jgi:outer membrane protein insertion porin family
MRNDAGASATGLGDGRKAYGVAPRLALVFGLMSSAAVVGPFGATQAYAQQYSFSNVVIEGNERVDAATIISYAGIARKQAVSAGDLNDAYQRIVNSGLFDAVVLEPRGGTLTIRVQEYPMINVVDFEGNKRIKDESLFSMIKSKSRRAYSPSQAEVDAAAISEAYYNAGRLAATVVPKIIRRDGNRVDLVFEIGEGKVVENERVGFVGNRAYSDRRLRQVVQTKQAGFLRALIKSDTFQSDRLEVDSQILRDFYLSRGYLDVQVTDAVGELSRERDATFVTYSIKEGQSFSIAAVSTRSEVEGVDAAEFQSALRLRSGVIYSPTVIDNNITRLENLALKKGLDFIRVEPVLTRNDRDLTVDVTFVISRGERVFVERIDIEGNATTLDQVIRRQFGSAEGDPFNPREIRNSAERVRALGHFTTATVDTSPGSAPDQVVVDVNVEEKATGSISFGATFGSSAGLGLNFGFTETNFLGRGQAFAINLASGADTRDLSFNLTEPAFLGRDVKFRFGGYLRTTKKASATFDTLNASIGPALEFPIGERTRLEVRARYISDQVSNYTGPQTTIIAAEAARGIEGGGSVGYTFTYDTRLTKLDPKNVLLFRFGQDLVGGGEIKYVASNLLAMAQTKVFSEEVTIRAILEAGVLNSYGGYVTRSTDRFNGFGKIRGFQRNGIGPFQGNEALGGNIFAVARFEADFPIGLPSEYGISAGLFYDIGSIWKLDNTAAGAIDDSFKLRSVIGASLLWETGLGPLRFNFSRPLVKEATDLEMPFEFTIQTKF